LLCVGQHEQFDGRVKDRIETLTLPELYVKTTIHLVGTDTANHAKILHEDNSIFPRHARMSEPLFLVISAKVVE
jgi:hypothetical protein